MEPEIDEQLYEKGKLYAKQMKSGLVYGPITSRRSGVSLGINPVKGGFLCNFDCIYCQYGNDTDQRGEFSIPNEIREVLEMRLKKIVKNKERIDSLTICGPTEPLLNPRIGEIIEVVKELRDKYLPEAEIDIFTNASRSIDIPKVDKVFLKFDAGFNKIEKPKDGVTKFVIMKNIVDADLEPKIIQSMWFKGKQGNYSEKYINDYIGDIKEIVSKSHVDLLQIYTMLYAPSVGDIVSCSEVELDELAKRITEKTGVKTRVFCKPPEIDKKIRF